MTVGELKTLLDSFNGGGSPRTINLGPYPREIEQVDKDYTADCEGRIGETVIVIGYGSY